LLSKSSKVWLYLLVVSAIIWLGAINIRYLIGNELLFYDEFSFRTRIPPDEENMIFKMVANTSIVIMCAYLVTFISAIFFVKTCRINLRENSWLLMCCILFFVFVPVEFYTSYLDIKFIRLFHSAPPNHDELLEIFGERIGFLKGVPWVAVLSYYFIILMAVFQPLKKSKEQLEEQKTTAKEHTYNYIYHEEDDLIIKDN